MDDLLEYAVKTLNMKPKPDPFRMYSDFVASRDTDMECYVCDVWLYEVIQSLPE